MKAPMVERSASALRMGVFGSTRHQTLEHPPLSLAQVQQFVSQGFLALPDFCEAAELAQIRSTVTMLFRDKIGHEEGKQFDMLGLDLAGASLRQPQIINPSLFAPELLQSPHLRRVA